MLKKGCLVKIHSLPLDYFWEVCCYSYLCEWWTGLGDPGLPRSGKVVKEDLEVSSFDLSLPFLKTKELVGPLCLWVRGRERWNRTWAVHLLPVCHVPRTSCSQLGSFLFTEHAPWLMFLCHPLTVWYELPRRWTWICPSYISTAAEKCPVHTNWSIRLGEWITDTHDHKRLHTSLQKSELALSICSFPICKSEKHNVQGQTNFLHQ